MLRPYQHTAISDIAAAYSRGARAPLLVLPTGAGKTIIMAAIARHHTASGCRILILVHRRELIRQTAAKLAAQHVPYGIIAPGVPASPAPVQIASVQTLARRTEHQHYDLIMIDEAHHACAASWRTVLARYPSARILGVTATPERLDGRGLGAIFDTLITGPTVADLIRDGYLVRPIIYAPAVQIDVTGIPRRAGDYARDQLERAAAQRSITGSAIDHYSRLAPGLPAIAYCVSVSHAEAVAAEFRNAGYRAASVDGSLPSAERDRRINGLADGSLQILTSCDIISEGLDVPSVGAVILLRPTQSLVLHLQQIGRGLRPAPNKTSLIVLDHAGNTLRHGLPTMPREWSLAGRPPSARRTTPSLTRCPMCHVLHHPAPACPECGHQYQQPQRRTLRILPGELQRLDESTLREAPLRDLLRAARTTDDLRTIAAARGYHPRWVWHIEMHRRRRAT